MDVKLKVCPIMCILGIFPQECKLSKENKIMTIYCILQAKYIIASAWKSMNKPSIQAWLATMSNSLSLERLTFILRGKYPMFKNIWNSFILFLEGEKAKETFVT